MVAVGRNDPQQHFLWHFHSWNHLGVKCAPGCSFSLSLDCVKTQGSDGTGLPNQLIQPLCIHCSAAAPQETTVEERMQDNRLIKQPSCLLHTFKYLSLNRMKSLLWPFLCSASVLSVQSVNQVHPQALHLHILPWIVTDLMGSLTCWKSTTGSFVLMMLSCRCFYCPPPAFCTSDSSSVWLHLTMEESSKNSRRCFTGSPVCKE